MPTLQRNPPLLCVFHALQMSLFPMAILTVFYRENLGMSMTEIMLVQGGFGLAMALFEFPSGYLADRIGYRRTMVIAAIMNAIGWSIYARADGIGGVIAGEIVLGVGISLISGSDQALLYESLVETKREHEYSKWNGRVRFWGQMGEGSAALVAGLMFAHWARLPFVAEAVVWVVNLYVAWRLVEPERHRPVLGENWKQVKALVNHVARVDPKLRAIMLLTIILGMSSFIPVWTIQLYATDSGLDASWLGVVWATANYSVAVSSLFSTRLSKRIGLNSMMYLCIALIAIGYAGMGLVTSLWGVAFYFVLTIMRGLFSPPLGHEEQRLIPSGDRAGFLSFRSLTFRSCFLIIAPLIGLGIDQFGQRPVLLVVGAILVTLALIVLSNLKRVRGIG
ncbi:MAG: MFS family permease [Planctomycetota bacterium]|jgi:MFS family permease